MATKKDVVTGPTEITGGVLKVEHAAEKHTGPTPTELMQQVTEGTKKDALISILESINMAPIERKMDVASGTTKRHLDGKTKSMKPENFAVLVEHLKALQGKISDVLK